MQNITFEDFNKLNFGLYEGNPIIKHFGLSSVAADPSVLAPKNSHDNKWHLFCHTWIGVYQLQSDDGINWGKPTMVVSRAMRPNIKYIDGLYYLYYERTDRLLKKGLTLLGAKWFSEICLTTSQDLISWTKPKKIIANNKDYHRSKLGVAISNPFLININGKNRLYYSSGLTYIEDCHFCEPTYISYAESDNLTGGFVSASEPIIKPDKDSKYLNLCSGCIKIYKLKDCYIGLQNGIYKGEDNKSHSAIILLKSNDGLEFTYVKNFLSPQKCGDNNWMAQYVYACDLVRNEDKFYLYFNARNVNNISGSENIGVYISK
ncbi:MAG: glycosyl hydrolase family 43 [Clostridia bacterium]